MLENFNKICIYDRRHVTFWLDIHSRMEKGKEARFESNEECRMKSVNWELGNF